jgi:hypothetical protein
MEESTQKETEPYLRDFTEREDKLFHIQAALGIIKSSDILQKIRIAVFERSD